MIEYAPDKLDLQSRIQQIATSDIPITKYISEGLPLAVERFGEESSRVYSIVSEQPEIVEAFLKGYTSPDRPFIKPSSQIQKIINILDESSAGSFVYLPYIEDVTCLTPTARYKHKDTHRNAIWRQLQIDFDASHLSKEMQAVFYVNMLGGQAKEEAKMLMDKLLGIHPSAPSKIQSGSEASFWLTYLKKIKFAEGYVEHANAFYHEKTNEFFPSEFQVVDHIWKIVSQLGSEVPTSFRVDLFQALGERDISEASTILQRTMIEYPDFFSPSDRVSFGVEEAQITAHQLSLQEDDNLLAAVRLEKRKERILAKNRFRNEVSNEGVLQETLSLLDNHFVIFTDREESTQGKVVFSNRVYQVKGSMIRKLTVNDVVNDEIVFKPFDAMSVKLFRYLQMHTHIEAIPGSFTSMYPGVLLNSIRNGEVMAFESEEQAQAYLQSQKMSD